MYVLVLELSDHGRTPGFKLGLEAELLSTAERRLRSRRQERTISKTRVGLVERGTSNNYSFQKIKST